MNDNVVCLGGVGFIFSLIGLFICILAIKDWRRYRESENWITTIGQITHSSVTKHRSSKGGTSYGVHITYSYKILGQSFEGNQLAFGSEGARYGTHAQAEKVIAHYPDGNSVTVYYDPNAPSQAVLERKYDSSSAILGVIFTVIGIGMTVYALIQYK